MRSSWMTNSASCSLCTPSPGNTRKVRAVAMRSSKLGVSFHMKSDNCTRKMRLGSMSSMAANGVLAAKMWNESRPTPKLGKSARHTTSHEVGYSLTVRPQLKAS